MTLRTDYISALDSKLAEARASGLAQVVNYAADIVPGQKDVIETGFSVAASKGLKSFVIKINVTFQPAEIREKGPLWDAYKTGVIQGLASEDLMEGDVVVSLDLSDQSDTYVALTFSF